MEAEAQPAEQAPQEENNESPQMSVRPPLAFIDPVLAFRHIDSLVFARILIENQSKTCSIIYRIKPYNSSSGRYKVRPLMGIIEAGGVASIHVDVNPGLAPININSDFFQVIVLSTAGTALESMDNFDRRISQNMLRLFWVTANESDVDPDYINISCKISHEVNKAVCIARAQDKAKAKNSGTGLLDGIDGPDLASEFRTPIRTWKRISGAGDVKDEVTHLANNITLWANYTSELQLKIDKLQFKFWVMFCVFMVSLIIYSVTLNTYFQHQQFEIRLINETITSLDNRSVPLDQLIQELIQDKESTGGHLQYVIIFSICAAILSDIWKGQQIENPTDFKSPVDGNQ